MPLPVRLLQKLIDRSHHPVLFIGIAVFGVLALLFALTDSWYPSFAARYGSNPLESTGFVLLTSTLSAYLFMCITAQIRSTPLTQRMLADSMPAQDAVLLSRLDQAHYWWVGMLLGLVFAYTSNVNWQGLDLELGAERFWWSVGVVIGQSVLWSLVGLLLAMKLHNGVTLYRIGKRVEIDLFNLDPLNSFGRIGLNDLLIVVGAMALTPLQSIDQEFRWVNYENAVYVGVPSAFILMLLPIWSVHRRIRRRKTQLLEEINAEIDRLPRTLALADVGHLNALLDLRAHVQHCRSWPMDLSIFSRVVLYVLIPPLAWIGAALVELTLDSFLQ